jgi:hypothetical protein
MFMVTKRCEMAPPKPRAVFDENLLSAIVVGMSLQIAPPLLAEGEDGFGVYS